MNVPGGKSLGEQNYEQFADRYAKFVRTKAYNAHYERPATLSLLPDVKGLRVLDAGCGPGEYAAWLVERGAAVVAFDVTPRMVEITQERLGDTVTALRHDLHEPLDFAGDEAFDLVICPLVLDYIKDWTPVFTEFRRVLKRGGTLVFSCGHPATDFFVFHNEGNYFNVEMFEMAWGGFGEPRPVVTSYRRSLADTLNPLIEAGLVIDHIHEARPIESFREQEPEQYEELLRRPGFLWVRARKP